MPTRNAGHFEPAAKPIPAHRLDTYKQNQVVSILNNP